MTPVHPYTATPTPHSRRVGVEQRTRQTLGGARHAFGGRGKPVVHFVHVGKTGGTALKAALRPVATAGPCRLDLHGHQFTLAQLRPGTRFFFSVRDPITRFVSGFYSRHRGGEPPSPSPWSPGEATAFREFPTPNELAEQIASNERARRAMNSIVHVRSPYSSWFGTTDDFLARRRDLLFILRVEHFDTDFVRLLEKLGLEGCASLPVDDARAHGGPPGVDRRLSERAVANLEAWYRHDFRFVALCEELAADL